MSPSSYKTLKNPDQTRSLFCQSEGKPQQSSAPIAPCTSQPGGAQQQEHHHQQLPPSHHNPHHPRQSQSGKKLAFRTGKQAPGFSTDVSMFLTIKPEESGEQGGGERSTDCICVPCAGRTSSPCSCGTLAISDHPSTHVSLAFPQPQPFRWAGTSRWHQKNRNAPHSQPLQLPKSSCSITPQTQLGTGANQGLLALSTLKKE